MQYNDYKYKYLKYKQKYFQLKNFIKQSNQKGGIMNYINRAFGNIKETDSQLTRNPLAPEIKTQENDDYATKTALEYEERQRKTIEDNNKIKVNTINTLDTMLKEKSKNNVTYYKSTTLKNSIIMSIIITAWTILNGTIFIN